MFMGKSKTALDSNVEKGGTLHLNDLADSDNPSSPTLKEVLISPPAQPAHSNCILDEEPQIPHPNIFDLLDASVVRSAASRVTGAAGPSGLDAHEWRHLCTSHKGASKDLCASLATVARGISSSYVDPTSIKPLLVCRLIALNKHP